MEEIEAAYDDAMKKCEDATKKTGQAMDAAARKAKELGGSVLSAEEKTKVLKGKGN